MLKMKTGARGHFGMLLDISLRGMNDLPLIGDCVKHKGFWDRQGANIAMGPLQDSDHMVQIRHTGTQIAHWDI